MKTISNMGLPVTRPEGLSTGNVRGTDSKANVAAVSEVVATPSAQPGTSFEGSGASVQRSHSDANVSREHAPVSNLGFAALGEAEYQLLSDRLLAQLKPRLAEALSGIETWATQSRQLPAFQVVADHAARAPAREADRLIEQNMRDVQRRVADINWSLAIVKDMLVGLGIDGKNVEASSPLVVALASAMKARASHATVYYQNGTLMTTRFGAGDPESRHGNVPVGPSTLAHQLLENGVLETLKVPAQETLRETLERGDPKQAAEVWQSASAKSKAEQQTQSQNSVHYFVRPRLSGALTKICEPLNEHQWHANRVVGLTSILAPTEAKTAKVRAEQQEKATKSIAKEQTALQTLVESKVFSEELQLALTQIWEGLVLDRNGGPVAPPDLPALVESLKEDLKSVAQNPQTVTAYDHLFTLGGVITASERGSVPALPYQVAEKVYQAIAPKVERAFYEHLESTPHS